MADINPKTAARYYTVYNSTTANIPPNSLVSVTGLDEDFNLIVGPAAGDNLLDGLLVTGSCPIPPKSLGQAHRQFPCAVAYDGSSATPAIGQSWGSVAGSYKLGYFGSGFTIMGAADSNSGLVVVDRNTGGFQSSFINTIYTNGSQPNFQSFPTTSFVVDGTYGLLLSKSNLAGYPTQLTLTINPADGSTPGIVTTTSQYFAGSKRFLGNVTIDGALVVNNTVGVFNPASTNASTCLSVSYPFYNQNVITLGSYNDNAANIINLGQAGSNQTNYIYVNGNQGQTGADSAGNHFINGICTTIGSGTVGNGTVTSVALSLPSIFTVTGSPITTSGTLTAALNTQSANTIFAGPSSGSAAAPTFRSLVSADIPLASLSAFGAVKPDGSTITISGGVISATASSYTLPTASISTLGGVKIDGTTITISGGGVISATASSYTLPTASTSTLGGVKIDGTTITISGGVISATQYSLPTASTTTLGGVKIDGSTIKITSGQIFTGGISGTVTLSNGTMTFTKGILTAATGTGWTGSS